MIDAASFAKQIELDLAHSGRLSPSTCDAWNNLAVEDRAALAKALAFLGCGHANGQTIAGPPTREADRIAASRLMLLKLGLRGNDPRWSSEVLGRLLDAVVTTPEGSLGDLFQAFFALLREGPSELSQSVANFSKELVVRSFTQYRPFYDAVDWSRFVHAVDENASPAQLYFALHAIPPQYVSADLAALIARQLEPTEFKDEATSALAG
jgi:hypothetical protein